MTFVLLTNVGLYAQSGSGRIRGVVRDKVSREPLIGATVYIRSLNAGTDSDATGNYVLVSLPAGNYELICSYIGYQDQKVKVKLSEAESREIDFSMLNNDELNTVTVEITRVKNTEKELLKDRKNSTNIQDAISLQQIERAAALNAAQALQKVTGVSIRDGKYLTVRGMTDRNLVIQMNGARMAGANPERSSVPLDLVLSQILDNITVEKSITPDKPGDATGAVVEITTRSIPREMFFGVITQVGYNSNTGLGGDILSFEGGDIGFWGTNIRRFNISSDFLALRDQYGVNTPGLGTADQIIQTQANIRNALSSGAYSPEQNLEAQRINKIYESFSDVLSTSLRAVAPNQIYSLSFGNRISDTLKLFGRPWLRLGEKELGFFVGLNYYRRAETTRGENNRFSVREPGDFSGVLGTPNIINPNQYQLLRRFSFEEIYSSEVLNYGLLASGSVQLHRNHSLSITYNGNFGAESFADRLVGSSNVSVVPVVPQQNIDFLPSERSSNISYALRVTERPFHTWQLRGSHSPFYIKVPSEAVKVNWSVSTSKTSQNDPDFRITRILIDSSGLVTYLDGSRYTDIAYLPSMTRYWRFLVERNYNLKVDLYIPIRLSWNREARVNFKTGAFYLERSRDYTESEVRRQEGKSNLVEITRLSGYGIDLNSLGGDIDRWVGANAVGIIEDASLDTGNPYAVGFLLNPQNTGNGYAATQKSIALYAMADFTINRFVRLVGGARIETTDTQALVDTVNLVLPPGIDSKLEFDSIYVTDQLEYKWLPSGSLILSPHENVKVRLAYSQTLARPEINEIVNSSQFDPIQQADIRGNNKIRNASYANYDLRLDWFIREEEILSGSVFYKTIDRQLERVFLPTGNVEIDEFGQLASTISFRNNPERGYLYGFEFEYRTDLGRALNFRPLKHVFGGVNAFLAKSETAFPDDGLYVRRLLDRGAGRTRPLFDQPNFILNGNLGWERKDWGSAYNIFFNWTGERLIEINTDGTPNIYEKPPMQLDFIFQQRLLRKKVAGSEKERHSLVLSGFLKNLLLQPTELLYKNSNRIGEDGVGMSQERYVRRSFRQGIEVAIGLRYTL